MDTVAHQHDGSTRILIVDDRRDVAARMAKKLSAAGYVAEKVSTGATALDMVARSPFDIVILGSGSGGGPLSIIPHLRSESPAPAIVLLMVRGQETEAAEALSLGATAFLLSDDEGSLELLPELLGRALQQRTLEQEHQESRDKTRHQARMVALLNEVNKRFATLQERPAIVQQLLEAAIELTNAEGSALWLSDLDQRGWLSCSGVWHRGRFYTPPHLRLALGQDVAGWVAQRRESVVVHHTPSDPRFTHELDEQATVPRRALLAVPLLSRNRVLGVLEVANKMGGAFDDEDRSLIEILAGAAGYALDNVSLACQVQELAVTDEVTGLHNHRAFLDLAGREFERAYRYDRPMAILLLEIDPLRQIRETRGQATGDEILRTVAKRFRQNIRDIDVLCRFGSEEFALLLPEASSSVSRQIAERLRKCLAEHPISLHEGSIAVNVTLGSASLDPSVSGLQDLLKRAEARLHAAKQNGRHRVEP